EKKLRNLVRFVKLSAFGKLVLPAKRNHAALTLITVKLELPERQLAHARHQRLLLGLLNQLPFVPKPVHHANPSHKKAQKAHKTSEKLLCLLCLFVAKKA